MTDSEEYTLSRNKEFCNFCPGYCCYQLPGASLYIMAEDINRIARHFHLTDGQVRQQYLENKYTFKTRQDGSCIFLSNNSLCKRCLIHESRPKQCRDFPYNNPCPYLESSELLTSIQNKIESSVLNR